MGLFEAFNAAIPHLQSYLMESFKVVAEFPEALSQLRQ